MILLGRIRLANYQSLSHLKRISIRKCQTITEVSCFRDVPHLTFDQCNGITDVSSLTNVSHLNLSSCGGIRELTGLNSVISLHLNKFFGNDISPVKNTLESLFITSCQRFLILPCFLG
jgi:hypothetical protein